VTANVYPPYAPFRTLWAEHSPSDALGIANGAANAFLLPLDVLTYLQYH